MVGCATFRKHSGGFGLERGIDLRMQVLGVYGLREIFVTRKREALRKFSMKVYR